MHSRNSTTEPYGIHVMPNQLVMVIARPINLNVSWKSHPYSLQRTRSPPGPRLPKRNRNTHLRNYYDFNSKYIDVHFFLFQEEELYCELNFHDQKIRRTLTHDIRKHWAAVSTLLGMVIQVTIRVEVLTIVFYAFTTVSCSVRWHPKDAYKKEMSPRNMIIFFNPYILEFRFFEHVFLL